MEISRMNETDKVAALLADGVWHSEKSLYNALNCPGWFYATLRKMRNQGLIEKQHDPFGLTWWRLW